MTEPTAEELAELRSKVASAPYWYHKIPLPGGIVTPGWAPLSVAAYKLPEDLSGKRVLDVGAWDGFWTFEALRRGAKQVVAIDDFSDNLDNFGSLKISDRNGWANFDLCRSALGYNEDRCQRVSMSVYEVTPQRLGKFDVVLFFGTIYHLRHPLLALDQLSAVCEHDIYLESAVCDDYSPYRGGFGHGYPGGQVVAEFYPNAEYGNNSSNRWVPTIICLAQMLIAAGFGEVQGWKLTENPQVMPHLRGFVKGSKASQRSTIYAE